MVAAAENNRKSKSKLGLIALCCFGLAGIFVAIFISTNNINISFDTFTSKDKYRAEAFVKKRKRIFTAKIEDLAEIKGIITGGGLSAEIGFDAANQKVKLSVRDENDKPVTRITVIGTVSRVGQASITKQFKLQEYSAGNFRSASLNLANGGWILMVSAYDLYTRNKQKLLFHSERPIFLGAS